MSKLFKLKNYFTVAEAAKHLSNLIEETVLLADLYRLVLDKHLIMSVRFNNQVYAQAGHYVCNQDDHSNALVFDKLVHVLDGVWDLAMIGTESQEIETLHQEEVGGPGPMYPEVNGFCLKRAEVIYKLQKSLHLEGNRHNFNALESRRDNLLKSKGLTIDDLSESHNGLVFDRFSSTELDEFMSINEALMQDEDGNYIKNDDYLALENVGYQFVIRTSELTRFVRSLQGEPSSIVPAEKPLGTRERNTLLVIIGSLLNELNIDPSQRGVTTAVQTIVELKGMTVNEVTIRNILRQVAVVIDNRQN
ncbi:hypothetical protein [Shewanella sp. cp20]|uniref:hypothetical protein n=1 Tax=Shewanella sp. cp20 TaxID=1521167 RepID=UPI0005A0993B|nr:hypothetical protein [Shewanella sp. cp20]KIO36321.1 hypothetical protein DB48_12400 [Shewanella sp. cp20]